MVNKTNFTISLSSPDNGPLTLPENTESVWVVFYIIEDSILMNKAIKNTKRQILEEIWCHIKWEFLSNGMASWLDDGAIAWIYMYTKNHRTYLPKFYMLIWNSNEENIMLDI